MDFIKNYNTYLENKIADIHFPKQPQNLYDPLRYILQIGGKRMRPMLTLLAVELFDNEKELALNSALAIELFHNFTLIHDDIMDNAPLRRGNKTVHEKWNEDIAILSGDVLFVKAYQLLSEQDKNLHEKLKLFNQTAQEVCEGQQLDMDFEVQSDVSIPAYIEMIRLKTSVLLACALELGAVEANASDNDRKHIYNFGQNIGIAFQIQDDILDLYADPEKFGKQVGGDVLSDKKTLLYLKCQELASKEQKEILRQLKNVEDPIKKIQRTKELFNQVGVRDICNTLKEKYYAKAKESLDAISVDSAKKIPLQQLGTYLLERDV